MIGNPYKWERHHHRLGATAATAAGKPPHSPGAGRALGRLYKIKETRNMNIDFTPIPGQAPWLM